jgi:hypothetical protein
MLAPDLPLRVAVTVLARNAMTLPPAPSRIATARSGSGQFPSQRDAGGRDAQWCRRFAELDEDAA